VGKGGREGERHFHSIQLLFLRYDLVDVWCEEGVCCHELGADRALDGGLDFGFRAGGNASFVSTKYHKDIEAAYSFLNILADLKGVVE
jgi:hypothetical protein